jgi:hypothetical protein
VAEEDSQVDEVELDEVDGDQDVLTAEEDSVAYELDDWAGESRSMLDSMLTSREIVHAWQGGTLVVRADDEAVVDDLIDEIDATSAPALDPDAEKVAYEVADWTDAQRTSLAEALAEAGLPYEWDENGDLVVHEADEDRVEDLLDSIEFPDAIEVDETDDGDGLAAQNVLSELFVSTDRLMHDAQDHEGVLSFVDAAHMAEDMAVPFGFSPESWNDIVGKARALREAFEADVDDDDAIMSQAAELRHLLRNIV